MKICAWYKRRSFIQPLVIMIMCHELRIISNSVRKYTYTKKNKKRGKHYLGNKYTFDYNKYKIT